MNSYLWSPKYKEGDMVWVIANRYIGPGKITWINCKGGDDSIEYYLRRIIYQISIPFLLDKNNRFSSRLYLEEHKIEGLI